MTIDNRVIEATRASLNGSLIEVARALGLDPATLGLSASVQHPAVEQARGWMQASARTSPASNHLQPIFGVLDGTQASTHVIAKRPLAIRRDVLFPQEPDAVNDDVPALQRTLKTLLQETPPDPVAAIEHWLEILRACGWCLPGSQPGVSAYDEGRIEAALAACLVQAQDRVPKPSLILVGVDLSGIQEFLYTLSSKRAAKTLRGRSFYLQLLTEAVLRRLLDGIGLTTANVLYSGGGHVYLLVPDGARETLQALQAELTRLLWHYHRTGLYIALGWAELSEPAAFAQAWQAMHNQLRVEKSRRYHGLGEALYETVFGLETHGGNDEWTCSVCGQERVDADPLPDLGEDREIKVCAHCRSMSDDIGEPLARQDWVRLGLGPVAHNASRGSVLELLAELGLQVSFDRNPAWPAPVARQVLWAFNDQAWETARTWRHDHLSILRRYTVNVIPPEPVREFSALVKEGQGIERLGVMRADVDDLGRLFRATAAGPGLSLTRVAALSSAMSLFFEGWVQEIAAGVSSASGQPLIYSVYSGGDDLFLIGPWACMPELAQRIAGNFAAYSTGRAHLCAGLVLVEEKYPVYQAADDAADALEDAKRRPDKNSISFLGETRDWVTFERIAEHQVRLRTLIEKGKVSRTLLTSLRQFGLAAAASRRVDSRIVVGPWLWRAVYQIKRAKDRAKAYLADYEPLAEALRAELTLDSYSGVFHLALAARWTQLSVRERQQANKGV